MRMGPGIRQVLTGNERNGLSVSSVSRGQCDDPEAVARKWAAIASEFPTRLRGWSMLLDNAEVRFGSKMVAPRGSERST